MPYFAPAGTFFTSGLLHDDHYKSSKVGSSAPQTNTYTHTHTHTHTLQEAPHSLQFKDMCSRMRVVDPETLLHAQNLIDLFEHHAAMLTSADGPSVYDRDVRAYFAIVSI